MQTEESLYYWQFSEMKERLAINHASSKPVYTMLKRNMLNSDAFQRQNCEIGDFDIFTDIMQCLKPLAISNQLKERIAFTIIACERFLVPNQPISWHFKKLSSQFSSQQTLSLAKLNLVATGDWINVLQFNIDGSIAECLSLEPRVEVAGLVLDFGQPFRIFANRLQQQEILIVDDQLQIYA